jgi:hypothetical protein
MKNRSFAQFVGFIFSITVAQKNPFFEGIFHKQYLLLSDLAVRK